jgi:hypothetical protein
MNMGELFNGMHTASHIDAVRKHVKAYRDMGIAVIPREFMSKGNGEEWKRYQTEPPTEAEIQEWFFSSETKLVNVAALLGPVSGNLLAIDVDGEAGQARMSKALSRLGFCNNLRGVLINTMMTRSGSRRGFHFLVRVDPQLLDDDNEKVDALFHRYLLGRAKQDLWTGEGEHEGISLLWKGSLSVLAPSVHPDGKCNFYVWNHKAPQTIMTAKELKELFSIFSSDGEETLWDRKKREWAKRCDRDERNNSPDTIPLTSFADSLGAAATAAASQGLLLRRQIADNDKEFLFKMLMKNNRYRKGNRHKIAMGVAGYLRWHGYVKEAALNFIDFMCDFFHDEERDSRRRDVEDTYSKPIEEIAWRSWLDGID